MTKYTACICEGSAERAILDLLLDHGELIFKREDLIEEEVLKCRKGAEFEQRYLRKGFAEKITVYRILDSHTEEFKLITAPEIEMLIIFAEGKYKEYEREKRKNRQLKPSTYCKTNLKHKSVKNYDFVKEYFSDISRLKNALHEYQRVSKVRSNEWTLWRLLRN